MHNRILSNYTNYSIDNTDDENISPNLNQILFFTILILSIPSLFLNLFALYRLHSSNKLSVFVFRYILYVSLFSTCTCIPFFLIELRFDLKFPFSLIICKLWLIIDYSSIVCLGLLVCWASIQRHILIFGPMYIKNLQSTIQFKLIPNIFACAFPIAWYSILIFTCEYDKITLSHYSCRPCFENEKLIFLIDTLISLLLPLFVTITSTFCLLIRIIRLRLGLFRSNNRKWNRCKRLTHQMILFSSIYSIGLLPYVLTNLNSLYSFCPFITFLSNEQVANALTYVPCCFSSFLSIYAFPEIRNNQRKSLYRQNCLKKRRKQKTKLFTLTSTSSKV